MTNPTPKQIRKARDDAGLTQQQAADLLYVTTNAWKKWEHSYNPLSLDKWELYQIKVLLDCPDDVVAAVRELIKLKVKR